MAKALIGHLNNDRRASTSLLSENSRLRARVSELESLVLRLKEENDTLTSAQTAAMLDADAREMLPA